jgi:DNA-binding transcriptional LysR family regulator
MFDLQQLRYFVAVAETENVGQAALALHISQSPLSRQVQRLEARLGFDLFLREKKRLRLTRAGRDFLDEARTLLAHATRVAERAKETAAGRCGTLAVGFVEGAVHAGVLGRELHAFQQQVPQVRVLLQAMRSAAQFQALQRGELDVGHTYSEPEAGSGLASTPVADEPCLLAIPATHPLSHGPLAWPALDGAPFIAMPESWSPATRQHLLAACAAAGFRPDIRCEAAEPSVVLGLVAAGAGLAVLQSGLRASAPPGVVMRELPADFALRVRIFRVLRSDAGVLASRWAGTV